MTIWTPEMLNVEPQILQQKDTSQHVLRPGTPLWHIVMGMGEQVILALDDLGFVRTDGLGQTHGFKVKDLAVTPDGTRALIHLDVTSVKLYQPAATTPQTRGKPVAYLGLTSDKVVEQIRVRLSEMLGAQVDVRCDNHYWVRYVADLAALRHSTPPAKADLVDHLADVPGPFYIPLGLDNRGKLHWYDLRAGGRHALLTGHTGGGKTTWLDAAITTLLRHTPPDTLKFCALDPQRVNFSSYAALTDYHYNDREGALGVVWEPENLVAAMVRLNREHLRRVELIGSTPWGNIEDYNAHCAPEERLPYVCVFTDELAVLRNIIHQQLSRKHCRTFDSALNSLIAGGRKFGFRLFLCLQYLKADYLPVEVAAQAGLILAFQNTPQGSRNTLGNSEAALLYQPGRFILAGLPGRRKVLQGLYVSRKQVLALLKQTGTRQTFPVDGMVMELLSFVLAQRDGALSRDPIHAAFKHLMSKRQIDNFIAALESVGLVTPGDYHAVPKIPKHLAVDALDAAVDILCYHPEIAFHTTPEGTLVFGPPKAGGRAVVGASGRTDLGNER